jgi:ParB family transcriptional regulator, chromosome partitioning protein
MPKFVNPNIAKIRTSGGEEIRDLIAPDKRVGRMVAIDEIFPNPNQPRKHFNEEALAELAESIQEHGLINPITVDDDGMILAGERRFRACTKLGMREVPVVRMNGSFEISLVENLQRQDLHPIEEAWGYQILVDAGNTHEQIAQRIAKDRSVVSHSLRLIELPADIQRDCVTSHSVTKDQLLQVVSAKSDEERYAIWEAIKAGKSARAIRREKKTGSPTKPTTPRMFINRIKTLGANADSIDLSRATDSERERLRAHLSATISSLQDMMNEIG